jgi:HSP20 family protein
MPAIDVSINISKTFLHKKPPRLLTPYLCTLYLSRHSYDNDATAKEVFMASTLWRTRTPFESMMSWFDHDLVTNDSEAILNPSAAINKKYETYVLKTDMPGMKKKDIHLELKNGMLTLRGELHERHEKTTGRYSFASFERKFRVPEGVTEKDIRTKYTDGVLELTIPVPKEQEPKP